MTMLRATAEANNLSALASAQEKYTENMDKVCGYIYHLWSGVNVEYKFSIIHLNNASKAVVDLWAYNFRDRLSKIICRN